MRSRNIVLTAFLSSLITILLVVAVFAGVGSTLANNASQEGDPPVPGSGGIQAPEDPDEVMGADYAHYSGSVFVPIYADTSVNSVSYGCSYATSGIGDLNVSVNLPNGSIVTSLRLYAIDNNGTPGFNGRLRFWQINDYSASGTYWLASTDTSLMSGVGTDTVSDLSIPIDNYNYSYILKWDQNDKSTAIQLCGARIGYNSPYLFGSAFPIIRK